MSKALWIVQVLLAALFVFAGAMKFVAPLGESPLPAGLVYFIGVVEILGGVGLIVPALTRIKPVLTPIAAAGLVVIMIGATVLTVSPIPAAVGALAAFVAVGRFRLAQIS